MSDHLKKSLHFLWFSLMYVNPKFSLLFAIIIFCIFVCVSSAMLKGGFCWRRDNWDVLSQLQCSLIWSCLPQVKDACYQPTPKTDHRVSLNAFSFPKPLVFVPLFHSLKKGRERLIIFHPRRCIASTPSCRRAFVWAPDAGERLRLHLPFEFNQTFSQKSFSF